MPYCGVDGCKNRSVTCSLKKNGVTFHRFPKDFPTFSEWVRACNRGLSWRPSRTSTVCSKHFEPHQFQDLVNKRRILKQQAVPTLELPEVKRNAVLCDEEIKQWVQQNDGIVLEANTHQDDYISKEDVARIMDTTARKVKEKMCEKNRMIHRLRSQVLYFKKKIQSVRAGEAPTSPIKTMSRRLVSRCAMKDKKVHSLPSSSRTLRKRISLQTLRSGDGSRSGSDLVSDATDDEGIDASRQPPSQIVEYQEVPIETADGGFESSVSHTQIKVEPESDYSEDDNESTSDRSASPTLEELEDIVPDKKEMFRLVRRLEAANQRVAQLVDSNQALEKRVLTLERKNKDLERNLQVVQKLKEGLAERSVYLEQRNERLRLKITSLGIRDSMDEDDEDVPPGISRRVGQESQDESGDEPNDKNSKRHILANASKTEPQSDLLKISRETNIKVENVLAPQAAKKRRKLAKNAAEPSTSSEKPFGSANASSSLGSTSGPSLGGKDPSQPTGGPGDPLLIPVEHIKTETEIKVEEEDVFQYTIETDHL